MSDTDVMFKFSDVISSAPPWSTSVWVVESRIEDDGDFDAILEYVLEDLKSSDTED